MLGSYLYLALAAALACIGSVLPDYLAGALLHIPHDVAICSAFLNRVQNSIFEEIRMLRKCCRAECATREW